MLLVNRIFERRIGASEPGFIDVAVVLELVWVLPSVFERTPVQIADCIEALLTADSLLIQHEQQVFEAVFALKRGTGEFEDALIGALNAESGCTHTLTFDLKASRLPYFKAVG